MEVTTTTIITALLGLMWTGMGLAFVINPKAVYKGLEDFYKSPGLMFAIGAITMILGALMMVFHMRWNTTWECVISAIGIVTFVKGIAYLGFPETMMNTKKSMVKGAASVRGWGMLTLVIGIALLYLSVL